MHVRECGSEHVTRTPDPASNDPESNNRVLIIVEQLRRLVPGGAGTYAAGVLSGLRQLIEDGEQVPPVTLLASRARRTAPTNSDGDERPDRIAASGFPLIESHLPGPLMTRAWDARLLHAPAGFRTVHATSLAMPPARGARVVATVHDLAWRHVPFAFPRHGLKWHEHALAEALGRRVEFVVPSRPVADELIEAGAEASRVNVIEPGSDHLPFADPGAASRLLDMHGVEGDFILSVSTLEPRKNLPRLIEAYSKIRESLPGRPPLVVVGPVGWGPGLAASEGVVLVGAVSEQELSALYARATLLAYVPLVEGFGLPPLEAMRAGTPVVASPIPSTGGAAFQVDPMNSDEIAQALLHVATDDEARDALAIKGRARAAELSWKSCARRHVELWLSGELQKGDST
jgi:glycosyltransferase involved in cell wall biosynthesis